MSQGPVCLTVTAVRPSVACGLGGCGLLLQPYETVITRCDEKANFPVRSDCAAPDVITFFCTYNLIALAICRSVLGGLSDVHGEEAGLLFALCAACGTCKQWNGELSDLRACIFRLVGLLRSVCRCQRFHLHAEGSFRADFLNHF